MLCREEKSNASSEERRPDANGRRLIIIYTTGGEAGWRRRADATARHIQVVECRRHRRRWGSVYDISPTDDD